MFQMNGKILLVDSIADRDHLPAENTKNQVHNEESTKNHHRYEIEKLPRVSHGVLNLK